MLLQLKVRLTRCVAKGVYLRGVCGVDESGIGYILGFNIVVREIVFL